MTTRIPPSTAAQWSEETRAILGDATPAAKSPSGMGPPNILYTIGHHPALLGPFLSFTSTLALQGVLPRRDSEVLALRASWNCQSAFEWGHHVEYGEAEGLTGEEIAAIAQPGAAEDARLSSRDRLLVKAADELHASQQLADETYEALRAALDEAQLVELTFVVGNYTMLSMVANATGVPLEERLPRLGEAKPPTR